MVYTSLVPVVVGDWSQTTPQRVRTRWKNAWQFYRYIKAVADVLPIRSGVVITMIGSFAPPAHPPWDDMV